ncbi:MAG: flagellar filament capping protein FliD [Leptospiraceae bacterium]|nr:flagellar filament capping protein FliD [Leptospiraceae bacterium]MCP5493691.1 flagellar filament capping protein FliD [Leptospiraceae bacterium]
MPSFISGMHSGHDTDKVVKQLVELEARPIKRWEKQNDLSSIQIKAWEEVKRLSLNLQNKTKALVSFTTPFSSKKTEFFPPGAIAGEATREAEVGKQKIEVSQLATRHKVGGEKVANNKQLNPGKFSIISGDTRVDIDFPGGGLDSLKESIDKYAHQIVRSFILKVDKENSVFSLYAEKYGVNSELKFIDPSGILKDAGLLDSQIPEPASEEVTLNIATESGEEFQTDRFSKNSDPDSKPEINGSTIIVKPNTAYSFPINEVEVKKFSSLDFLIGGGDASISYPDYLGVGVYFKDGDEEKPRFENLPFKNGKYTLNVSDFIKGKKIIKIILSNTSGEPLPFSKVMMITPGDGGQVPKTSVIIPAQNAVFKIDGIEVERDSNENIMDVLKGVALTLYKTTEEPVELHVEVDASKGIEMIKEFVDAYNDLVKFSREMTIVNKQDNSEYNKDTTVDTKKEIGKDYWENKANTGILASDAFLIRLYSGLRNITSASYPSSTEPRLKVLYDVGITTGEVGASWTDVNKGLLVINEENLKLALTQFPDSVKELFASDNNHDSLTDDGVGYSIIEVLKPYTRPSTGIIASKIKLSQNTISENNRKIKKHESYLVKYEDKLKLKFSLMEKKMGKNKAMSTFLKNSLRQMRSNSKDDE